MKNEEVANVVLQLDTEDFEINTEKVSDALGGLENQLSDLESQISDTFKAIALIGKEMIKMWM